MRNRNTFTTLLVLVLLAACTGPSKSTKDGVAAVPVVSNGASAVGVGEGSTGSGVRCLDHLGAGAPWEALLPLKKIESFTSISIALKSNQNTP